MPPLNDDFASRIVLTGASGSTSDDTSGATGQVGEPHQYPYDSEGSSPASVWFEWTPAATAHVQIDTIGSGWDTVLNVFTGSTLGSLVLVGASDDDLYGVAAYNRESVVRLKVTGGTTYMIRLGGSGGAVGAYTLNWGPSGVTDAPAVPAGQAAMLTANGADGLIGDYVGRAVVHLRPLASPPGDGLVGEYDLTVPLTAHPLLLWLLEIGNDSDFNPARFAAGVVIDTAELPWWVTYIGHELDTADRVLRDDLSYDSTFTYSDLGYATTVDTGDSVAGWDTFSTPYVDSVTPAPPTLVAIGASVVINGSGLTGATAVHIGGTSASFTVDSDSQITATVPTVLGGLQGVNVTVAAGTLDYPGYVRVDGPRIDSLSPTHGLAGASVIVTGKGFTDVDAAVIGSVSASSYTIDSDTQITMVVGPTAPVGPGSTWVHSVSAGYIFGPNFTVDPPPPAPTITGYSPSAAYPGDTVTIIGTAFTGINALWFALAPVAYTFVDDNHVTFTVPGGAAPGMARIDLFTPYGTATDSFRVKGPPPSIASFSPDRSTPDGYLDVHGSGFTGTTSVRLATIDLPFTVIDDGHVRAGPIPRGGEDWMQVGWSAGATPAADQPLTVVVVNADGTDTAPGFTLMPLLFVEAWHGPGASMPWNTGDGDPTHLVPLDATHTLAWGPSLDDPTLGGPTRLCVIDHTNPSAITFGASVLLFSDVLGSPTPAPADHPWIAVSPDGSTMVALQQWDFGGGGLGGTLAQVITRSGTTLTQAATQTYSGSGAQPGVYVANHLTPVMLSNTRLLAAGQPNSPMTAVTPQSSLWAVSSAAVGSSLWVNGPDYRDLRFIDVSHVAYGDDVGGTFSEHLRVAHITDAGPSVGDPSAATFLSSSFPSAVPMREETGRLGWYRGYDQAGSSLDDLYAMEVHLDPSAMTAASALLAEFGGISGPLFFGGFSPSLDGSGAFAYVVGQPDTSPPAYDLDGLIANLNTDQQIVIGMAPSAVGPGGSVARVLDYPRRYAHRGFQVQNRTGLGPPLDAFRMLDEGTFLTLAGSGATPSQVYVYRLRVANPVPVGGLRWGWPLA